MCHWTGYDFCPLCPKFNRVWFGRVCPNTPPPSLFFLLISWVFASSADGLEHARVLPARLIWFAWWIDCTPSWQKQWHRTRIVVKTRYHEGSVSCYKQRQSYITIHEVPTKQNGRRVKYSFSCDRLVEVNRKRLLRNQMWAVMSCSVPVFACIQDVDRVISILNDAPTTGEEDVKESTGESDKLFTNDTLFQNRLHN